MNLKKPLNLTEAVIDEVALEGLDGITLEALWQRLSVRLDEPLPFTNAFMQQIWTICLELQDFTIYELEKPRENLVVFDYFELEYMGGDSDVKEFEAKDIYPHCPIEDVKTGNRGSCSAYYTRKNITDNVRNLCLSKLLDEYGQKLVIVASQTLREQALIDIDANPNLQLPIAHYCLLERVGRARRIGEITIKRSGSVKEDAKTLFYIRKGLQEHGLIRKQVYYQGNNGPTYNGTNIGTLIHLARFFHTRKPKVIVWAEHLIDYLKLKENHAAEYNEVKNELNLDYSIKKFFKIQILQKVFRTDLKVPYRSYYPTSTEKEWAVKNNPSKERIIKLVTLSDPNIEISDLWRTEDVDEEDDQAPLDVQKQKFNVPFLRQIYSIVESKGSKGVSQMELAHEMGLTKLTSRTLVRNLVRTNVVSTYLDDIGRQRTTKFVSRRFDAKSSLKKQFEAEISKMKKYSESIKTRKIKEIPNVSASKQINNEKLEQNIEKQDVTIIEKEANTIMIETEPSPKEETKSVDKGNSVTNTSKNQVFSVVSSVLKKYKLSQIQYQYQYTSSKNCSSKVNLTNYKNTVNDRKAKQKITHHSRIDQKNELISNKKTKKAAIRNQKDISLQKSVEILETDFYKTIEAKLIVQKPECKKRSQRSAIVGFMENMDGVGNKQSNISYRLLRRANLVIESVKEHKIIEDLAKLIKYIHAEEDKEGLDAKIDKNSLIRLLQKLAEDNLIKYIKLILRNKKQTRQKVIDFICDPNVDVNDAVIQSAVEQAKLKFCIMDTQSLNTEKFKLNSDAKVTNPKGLTQKVWTYSKNSRMGKRYGYSPKFQRMKMVHIFLYHLVYDHPGHSLPKSVLLENLEKGLSADEILDEETLVYSASISWKTFISPLPDHKGYPLGWALMSDVLLRMPLSIFVKVHNVNWEVPGLEEYLDHPIKRHFLVKNLPALMRDLLFLKRKYMFSIHEIVTKLCYMGLIQFGTQMLKEKDQVFIYINRHSELLDTTSSAAGYHRIEDKPYPVTKFQFTSINAVEKYWYEMWTTCINTCLGGRSVVEGKDILLEDLSRKVEMIQATKMRQPLEAPKFDTGFVPGDRKGAAGIDSAFFPHLKRNWNWISTSQKDFEKKARPVARMPRANMKAFHSRKIPQRKRTTSFKQNQARPLPKMSGGKSARQMRPALKVKHEKGQLNAEFPKVTASKPIKMIRKVLPRKQMRKRVKYDEIDCSALQRMDKLRVDWEQHEDNILLVCKVAMVYLCPNPRRNQVSFSTIRDILRSYSFTSHNKTSRACQRRLLYMLKQSKTINSVMLGVEEVKQDYYVNKCFGNLVDSVRGNSESAVDYENRIEKAFKDLVTYIAKKYYNIADMDQREPMTMPKTIQEFNIFYKLKLPTKTMKSPGILKEVREINDIHTATINSVIHSSMCCGKEKRSWAYQLFKVYQQYPEYLLRSAMLKIRADQMVTMKKNYMCANKKFGNCMPMSSSQYQLSCAYYYKFQTKWPYEIFSETFEILHSLLENYAQHSTEGIEVKPSVGGTVATIHDFFDSNSLKIDIELPDQIIMLDPGLPEKDEVYQRIALRYQTILDSLSSDYTDQIRTPSNYVTQPKESNPLVLQNVQQIDVTNEQQSFVEIRSAKRALEHDYCLPKAKREKLDTEEVQLNTEQNNEESQSKYEIIDNESQCNDGISTKKKLVIADNSENIKSQVETDIVHTQSEPMEVQQSTERITFESDNLEIIQVSSKDHHDTDHCKGTISPTVENNSTGKSVLCEKLDNSNDAGETQHLLENTNVKSSPCVIDPNTKNQFKQISSNDENLPEATPPESSKPMYIRVSELVERANEDATLEDSETRADIHDVRTRQTRIAMLKMREELHDLNIHDSHHAHEFFVVNSFRLLFSLDATEEDQKDLVTYKDMELPKKLLPLNTEVVNNVLDDIKKFAIFPKNPMPIDDFKRSVLEEKSCEWTDVNEIYKFIRAKVEFGATLHELSTNFEELGNKLADILLLLSEKRIVLRAGIVAVRYIHYRYVNPWIIHSYKILRLEKESHPVVPEGSVYVLDQENDLDKDKDANRVTTAANLFYKSSTEPKTSENSKKDIIKQHSSKNSIVKNCDGVVEKNEHEIIQLHTEVSNEMKSLAVNESQNSKEENDDEEENLTGRKRMRRNRTVLLKQKDIYRAAKLLDFNTAEEIKVVIKPWIRIDGVLNRRVLDRMLGAVLCYCIEKPGLSLAAVQNRFTPAIQPYHTRELIEILVKLSCIKMTVQNVPKVTLFSKPAKLDLNGNPDLNADSNLIAIEPSVQATIRFGAFLSNRSYNLDFLSSM